MIAAAAVSPDAALGAIVVIALAAAGAFWKLATMLADIRSELRHNGGGSLKDKIHSIGAAVDQIKVTIADNGDHLNRVDERVTEHRRRNDAAILSLRNHLDKRMTALAEGQIRSDGLQSVLHELGIKDRDDREEREG